MSDGYDPIERYLIDVLSHGERRPTEIKSIARNTRWNQRVVVDKLRDLEESTELIEKRDEGGAVYYSLTDSSKSESLKPAANPEEVSSLLTQLELQLGIKDRNISSFPTERQKLTIPEVLAELNEITQTRKHVFNQDNDLLERFYNAFDEFLEMVANTFQESDLDLTSLSFLSISTIHQFLHLTIALNKEWRSGNVMLEFNKELRKRDDDLIDLLRNVPPELGVRIHAIGVSLDPKVAREMVKEMISTGDYSTDQLLRAIEKTYISPGKTPLLFKDLNMGEPASSNQVSDIFEKIREQFRNDGGTVK